MLRLLLDTNAFTPLEPVRAEDIEEQSEPAADLRRIASRLGGHLLLHPESVRELRNDRDQERLRVRELQIRGMEQLANPPPISMVEAQLGSVPRTSNDWVDHHLLAAVFADAVHHLITEDDRIHRKARRLGLEAERILRIRPALSYLRTLLREPVDPPPAVHLRFVHELDRSDPIFQSLRGDYPDFDSWLSRIALEQRQGWTIESPRGYAGICLWKEQDDEFGLGGKVMKVSTFKVSETYRGHRYGDLLLKALFQHLSANVYDAVWLTVFDRHAELIELLREFGFQIVRGQQTSLGELIMVKRLVPTGDRPSQAFEFHRTYGPPAVDLSLAPTFIIPIQPRYHRLLFPDYEQQATTVQQPSLPFPRDPFGNALRKAYLSRSGIHPLPRGATILMYRSEDEQGITAIGVVETAIRSRDPSAIAQFTNLRTVYSFEEITELASREVLAIRFRQDRLLPAPIGYDELRDAGVLRGRPQTITEVTSKEAITWLSQRIDRLH